MIRRLPRRPRAPARPHRRGHPRPLRRRRPRARSPPWARRCTRHARRVRRLRMPVLRAGRDGDPRAAVEVRRRPPLRLAPPAAQRRPRSAQLAAEAAEAAPPRAVLGDVRRAARAPGRAANEGPRGLRRASSGSTSSASGRSCEDTNTRERVAEDVASADTSGVSGTPSFFINGRRYQGAYDIATLTAAVQAARRRARLLASAPATAAPA